MKFPKRTASLWPGVTALVMGLSGALLACCPSFAPPTRVGVSTLPKPAGSGGGAVQVGGGWNLSASWSHGSSLACRHAWTSS
jgi:hypothetical protein